MATLSSQPVCAQNTILSQQSVDTILAPSTIISNAPSIMAPSTIFTQQSHSIPINWTHGSIGGEEGASELRQCSVLLTDIVKAGEWVPMGKLNSRARQKGGKELAKHLTEAVATTLRKHQKHASEALKPNFNFHGEKNKKS